ncbi:hypothetical protein [Odoribacter lunatus]|uniref:hypothetical protein n=1 Tax=Odoribacter lunatus TaxID=2941335 RepID=UPI0020425CA7|nr:hypothetical protein [Odoribacter lunatus]
MSYGLIVLWLLAPSINEAGVEIMSPHYFAKRDGSASTIPEDYLKSESMKGDIYFFLKICQL